MEILEPHAVFYIPTHISVRQPIHCLWFVCIWTFNGGRVTPSVVSVGAVVVAGTMGCWKTIGATTNNAVMIEVAKNSNTFPDTALDEAMQFDMLGGSVALSNTEMREH